MALAILDSSDESAGLRLLEDFSSSKKPTSLSSLLSGRRNWRGRREEATISKAKMSDL
jgi:hypothetical protein